MTTAHASTPQSPTSEPQAQALEQTPRRGQPDRAFPHMVAEHLSITGRVMGLLEEWAISNFYPGQAELIVAACKGQDALGVLPTGGGKSLCYQLPAVLEEGMTLVIAPLISLMKDQVDSLADRNISAAAVTSQLHAAEIADIYACCQRGDIKLLYVAPERLANIEFICMLVETDVAAIVVDEAHCISEWGHDFRPAYREIDKLRRILPEARVAAFTATATRAVQDDIIARLQLHQPAIYIGDFDRPNLTLQVERRSDVAPTLQIIEMIKCIRATPCTLPDSPSSLRRSVASSLPPGIIYCITRAQTERLAEDLRKAGLDARAYHAGMDDAARDFVQDAFMGDDCAIIVATIAFGMGIDKPNVRWIIHASMPSSIEVYHQEIGRAGRDGNPATCVTFWDDTDFDTWLQVMGIPADCTKALADEATANRYVALCRMTDYCGDPTCRHQQIKAHFGQVDLEDTDHQADPADPDNAPEPRNCRACDVCLVPQASLPAPVATKRRSDEGEKGLNHEGTKTRRAERRNK